ncbi:pro-corazonin-like [Zerene cesonia]|uniref:pro-corazonin-like n=1 Tax=Zerene cesonia TaxID=33412 RepID=UPI0018E5549E|nr:pro-corazonin-like [Zerene cesonia]
MTNITLLLIIMTLTLVTSQTFQYSRGWTNGKRDGHKTGLDKILSPCQVQKLKYLVMGKPFTERLLVPCDDEDDEIPKRYRNDHQDISDTFQ